MNRKEDVISVISKHSEARRNYEVEAILPWLKKKSQLLQNLGKSVLMDLVKHCEYKTSVRDEVIIKQGDKGDCFYIIIEGSVSIYIDAKLSGEDEIAVVKDDDTPAPSLQTDKQLPEKHSRKSSNAKVLDRSRFGRYIIKFGEGKSFGEIALISEDCVRNASIIVDEKTEFLVIHKYLFDRCLKAYQEREYAAVQNFVHQHAFFQRWHPLKRLLEMSLRKESFVYDSVIVKQGDPVTGLTFFIRGEGVVSVQPETHRKQYRRLWPFETLTDLYASEFDWLRESRNNAIWKKYQNPSSVPTRVKQVEVKRSKGYTAAEKLAREKNLTISNIQNNEVVGDIETILCLDTFMQTVKCSANTDVYILDYKNFDRLIVKRNPKTLSIMREHVEDKLQSRMESQNGSSIPLLRYLLHKMRETHRLSERFVPPLMAAKKLPDNESLNYHMLEKFVQGKAELLIPYIQGGLYYKDLMREKARIRESIRQNIASKSKQKKLSVRRMRKPRSVVALRYALEEMIHEDFLSAKIEHSTTMQFDVAESSSSHHKNDYNTQNNIVIHGEAPSTENVKSNIPNSPTDEDSKIEDDNSGSYKYAAQSWLQGQVPSYLRGVEDEEEDVDLGLSASPIVVHKSGLSTSNENSSKMVAEKQTLPSISNPTTTTYMNDEYAHQTNKETHVNEGFTDGIVQVYPTRNADSKYSKGVLPSIAEEDVLFSGFDVEYGNVDKNLSAVNNIRGAEVADVQICMPSSQNLTEKLAVKLNDDGSLKTPVNFKEHLVDETQRRKHIALDSWAESVQNLELRLQEFHLNIGTASSRKFRRLPKLCRYTQQTGEEFNDLKPGGRVRVHRKGCALAKSKYPIINHEHVRYFMSSPSSALT